jgi:hypothetical protein
MRLSMKLEQIQSLVRKGQYFFYTHALTEAKKDGVEPEDVVGVILSGKVIEEYPDRKRVLLWGEMANKLPLHVVCDYSAATVIVIPTAYIPSSREWVKFRIRKPLPKGKRT